MNTRRKLAAGSVIAVTLVLGLAATASAWDSDGWAFGPYTYGQQSGEQLGNPSEGAHDCVFKPDGTYQYKSRMLVVEVHDQAACSGYRSDPDGKLTVKCYGTVYGVSGKQNYTFTGNGINNYVSCNVPSYYQGTVVSVSAKG